MERCRFCYKAVEVEFCKNIFNNEQTNPPIPKIVEMLTNLTIVENDPYTKLACLDCFNILVILYHYRETILQTNQLLLTENEINMNNNKNDGNFHEKWPRIKRDDDGQFIVINNNSANLTETTLQIKSEPDDENHKLYNNDQHLNISMDNDEEMTISDNKNDTKTDNSNQQLDNSLCIKGDNEQILGFIKDEIKIEDVCLKIESEPDDEDHTICNNNQHSNISIDNDEEMTNNDNKNGTNISNYNQQLDDNSLYIERDDEQRLDFAKDEIEIEEMCSEIGHIKKIAENDIDKVLPEKSSHRYWKEYDQFIKWCGENNVSSFTEHVLLAYFEFRSKNIKSSTLWSMFSMLKSTINIKHNLSIDKYTKLIAFLKRKKVGYLPKKSKTLEIEEIRTFINEAPNEDYLMIKVALIIATCAACRRHELPSLGLKDVKDRGDVIVVTIPDAKTKKPRTCCIREPLWIDLIRKYLSIRPTGADNGRFFLFYSNNKCSRQPVGIHSFGNMPCKIATFLKLENPAQYTGHCFRRSSAKILAGRGADITTLKRHGGWKSSTVAKGYIKDSLKAKTARANQLNGQKNDSLNVPTSSSQN